MEWWNRVIGLASNAISLARRNILPRDTHDGLEWTTVALASSLISEGWKHLMEDNDRVGKDSAESPSLNWACHIVSQALNTSIRRGDVMKKELDTATPSLSVLKTGTQQLREDVRQKNSEFLRTFYEAFDKAVGRLPRTQRAFLEPAKRALVKFQRSGGHVSHLQQAILHTTRAMETTSLSDDARRLTGSIAMAATYIYWSKMESAAVGKMFAVEIVLEKLIESFSPAWASAEVANTEGGKKTMQWLRDLVSFACLLPPAQDSAALKLGREFHRTMDGSASSRTTWSTSSSSATQGVRCHLSAQTIAEHTPPAPGDVDRDRRALLSLFNRTDGPNWLKKSNWCSSKPLDEWDGVATDGAGRVVCLHLPNNNLRGSIPDNMGDLTALTYLNLESNQLRGSIPEKLGGLRALIYLNLSWNQLSGWIPRRLGGLNVLAHLDLSSNDLQGAIPLGLVNLVSLTYMDLSWNNLSGSIPGWMRELRALIHLNLSWNRFSGPIPDSFEDLKALNHLDLSSNQLSGSIPEKLGKMSALVHMNLNRNKLSGSLPAKLGGLSKLTYLSLSWNGLCGSIPERLGGLAALTYLNLSWNQLTGTIPDRLRELTKLLFLDLSRNQLNGSIRGGLGDLTALTHLNLSSNNFDGPIPDKLGNLLALTYLDLSRNKLSGSIPVKLGNLVALTQLKLNLNKLTGPIPEELSEPACLMHLSLRRNQLDGLIPGKLCKLKTLAQLSLSRNQLTGSIPDELGELPDLTHLYLNWNRLVGSIPERFGKLTSLIHLSVSWNQLSGSVPLELGELPNLTHADFDSNAVDDPGDVEGIIARRRAHRAGILNTTFARGTSVITLPLQDHGDQRHQVSPGRQEVSGDEFKSLCTDPSTPPSYSEVIRLIGRSSTGQPILPSYQEAMRSKQLSSAGRPTLPSYQEALRIKSRPGTERSGFPSDRGQASSEASFCMGWSGYTSLERQTVPGLPIELMSEQGRRVEETKEAVFSRTMACARADSSSSGFAIREGAPDRSEHIENPMQPDRHKDVISWPRRPTVERSAKRRLPRETLHDNAVAFPTKRYTGASSTSSPPVLPDEALECESHDENQRQPDHHQSVLPEPATFELVPENPPLEETTFFSKDAGVRLYVGPSCCARGQVVGPVFVREASFLVHCDGRDFLVSTVVDCHPSGSTFDAPLCLDFVVGDTLEQDIGAVELDEDLSEQLEDYKKDLLDDHKILWCDEDGTPWHPLGEDKTEVEYDENGFFLRGKVDHFSRGCLAKSVDFQNACHIDVVSFGRPKPKEIEFLNATDRSVVFLVLPTSWTNRAIGTIDMGLQAGDLAGFNVAVSRAVQQAILKMGLAPVIVELPPRDNTKDPEGGQKCPFMPFYFPAWTGDSVRVALMTVEGARLKVWTCVELKERTRFAVLPRQFSPCMTPLLGDHPREAGETILQAALTALVKNDLPVSTNEPVSMVLTSEPSTTTILTSEPSTDTAVSATSSS